jgi:hypothetical protein
LSNILAAAILRSGSKLWVIHSKKNERLAAHEHRARIIDQLHKEAIGTAEYRSTLRREATGKIVSTAVAKGEGLVLRYDHVRLRSRLRLRTCRHGRHGHLNGLSYNKEQIDPSVRCSHDSPIRSKCTYLRRSLWLASPDSVSLASSDQKAR